MHGEYKTPAGKLVVVDFGVEDDRLSNVVVSGDFFLEPPEALADIVRALEGARADGGRYHDRRARPSRGSRAQYLRDGGLDLLYSLKLKAVNY